MRTAGRILPCTVTLPTPATSLKRCVSTVSERSLSWRSEMVGEVMASVMIGATARPWSAARAGPRLRALAPAAFAAAFAAIVFADAVLADAVLADAILTNAILAGAALPGHLAGGLSAGRLNQRPLGQASKTSG